MSKQNYDAKDIVVLEGLDAVRLRPGMYIGTTGSKGMHHLLWEIVDNAIDEIANGHGDTITITINKDKNPNAKQRWFDDYVSGEKKNLPIKYFQQLLRRRMK